MPSSDKHIHQAQSNINHLSTFFSQLIYKDWVVTVSFYSSVHIVEAAVFIKQALKFKGEDVRIQDTNDIKALIGKMKLSDGFKNAIKESNSHEIRDIIVSENFIAIADDYHVLWKQSSDARYQCWEVQDFVANHAVRTSLFKIVAWFNQEFKQNIIFPQGLMP